jgi:pimeloyl-ACP methyl ester carboxylesterase
MSVATAQADASRAEPEFTDITWRGKRVRIEHAWVGAARSQTTLPLIVFLHEGLGSVAMWRDFPARLCSVVGARGLVYSRPGYGKSTPRHPDDKLTPEFMHHQAHEVLPALLTALGVDTLRDKPWLFGHSDGGSIALLHAARFSDRVAGLIVLAPHIMVEALSVQSIQKARTAYVQGDLRARLAKYHDDVDSAFFGWNDIWLEPAFGAWSIEVEIASITCPVLAIQGIDDEYGTLAQLRGIAHRVGRTLQLELRHCGHSPHRDQAVATTQAVADFMRENLQRSAGSPVDAATSVSARLFA